MTIKYITSTALASILLLTSTPSLATELATFPDLKTAKSAVKSKDYMTAAQHWIPLAQKGVPEAQAELGKLYNKGLGVKQDNQTALNLFISAAEQGDVRAMFEIGRLYERGEGVQKDPQKAKEWYQLAANSGYARGYYGIGQLYEKNKFDTTPTVKRETREKIRAAVNAIKDGDYNQATYLANLYQTGIDVPQDNKKALTYFLVSEKSGLNNVSQQIESLKTKLSLDEYTQAYQDSSLLLARNDRPSKERRKELIRSLKRIEKPTSSPIETKIREEKALKYYESAAKQGYDRAQERMYAIQDLEPPQKKEDTGKYTKKYKITGDIKTQFVGEENLDLGTQNDDIETAFVLDGKTNIYLYPTDKITTFVQARGFINNGVATSNNNDDDSQSDTSFIELRQAWVEFDELGGIEPLSAKLGRQRFYDPRGIWWNRDLDAARVALNSTLTNGFLAVGENQSLYRLGDDEDLEEDEEDRFRILGEISHYYQKNHVIEGRFLYEDDNSGVENIGDIVSSDDDDDFDNELIWFGARAKGVLNNPYPSIYKLQYRGDLMGVAGEETLVGSTANANPEFRTVNSIEERDVFGWAFDGSVDMQFDHFLEPTITLGYAYGSGDDGDGDDSAFRQTDLEGNTSRFPEGRNSNSIRNYGEVLKPELSNIHILNTGVNVPVLNASDINLNYFAYWLDEEETGLRSSSISAPVNGEDQFLGQALDLAAHIYLGEEIKNLPPVIDTTLLRIRAGGFKSGDAYGDADDEFAFRGSAELRVKF